MPIFQFDFLGRSGGKNGVAGPWAFHASEPYQKRGIGWTTLISKSGFGNFKPEPPPLLLVSLKIKPSFKKLKNLCENSDGALKNIKNWYFTSDPRMWLYNFKRAIVVKFLSRCYSAHCIIECFASKYRLRGARGPRPGDGQNRVLCCFW